MKNIYQGRTFRFFVSSTFNDFSQERRLLQEIVFPKIKQYCASKSLVFQAIDLRWGVSNEAQLDQKTLELCLDEVKYSKLNPYPNFLIMLGNRYGWIPLPYSIEKSEYETIIEKIDNSKNLDILNSWYILDENQIPSSYILKAREGEYIEYSNWEKIENTLREILQNAVNLTNLEDSKKEKYFTSATESEAVDGILKYIDKLTPFKSEIKIDEKHLELDYKNVFAYLRDINSIQNEFKSSFIDENQDKVSKFKAGIRKSITNENIIELKVDIKDISQNSDNKMLNYTYKEIEDCNNSLFVEFMLNNLKKSIDNYEASLKDLQDIEIEKLEQDGFKKLKQKDFLGREQSLKFIQDYISSKNNEPLVIYGKSGLGKSSIMAKAIDETIKNYSNKKIVYKFIGSTSNLTSTLEVLISILKEFGIDEELRKVTNLATLEDKFEKIEEFYYRVYDHLKNIKEDVVIFIDAIDQVANEDDCKWLPSNLQDNLKIVISALDDENYIQDSRYFESLKTITNNLHKIDDFNKDSAKALILKLLEKDFRTISDNQMNYLLNRYKDVNTPLYLLIASQELKHCKSDTNLTLENSQKGIIKEFIENLSSLYYHDKEFVKRVFAYIYQTDGLTQSELVELISSDEELFNKLVSEEFHVNSTKEFPIVIWARLYSHIKSFLKEEQKDSLIVMKFFHREFEDIAKEILEEKENLHLITLLQNMVLKYQDEDNSSNRWLELYLEALQKYHLKYEFKYVVDESSYLATTSKEFINQINNDNFLNKFMLKIGNIGIKLYRFNETKKSNFYLKIFYILIKELYKKDSNKWAEDYTNSLNNLAFSLDDIEETSQAIKLYENVLEVLKELYNKDSEQWVEAYTISLNNLAFSLNKIEEIPKAIELQKEALNILKELYNKDSNRWAERYTISLNNLASSLYKIGETSQAIELHKKALEISKELYNQDSNRYAELYTKSLINLAYPLYKIGETPQAIELNKEALNILKELYNKDSNIWVEAYTTSLINLASFLYEIEEISQAIELNKEALNILKKLYNKDSNRWVEAYTTSLNNLALSLDKIGETIQAIELHKEALEISKELYNQDSNRWSELYTRSLNDLAVSLDEIGEISQSIKLSKESLEIRKELYKKDSNRWAELYVRSLNNLASSLYKIGEISQAIELHKEAIKILKELYNKDSNRWVESYTRSLNDLAVSLDEIGEISQSIKLSKESLEIRKELYKKDSNRWAELYVRSLNNLASSLYKIGDISQAINLLNEALGICKELYSNVSNMWVEFYIIGLGNLSRYLHKIGDISQAINLLNEALEILKVLSKKDSEKWEKTYNQVLNVLNILKRENSV